jgi:hypothetical protein
MRQMRQTLKDVVPSASIAIVVAIMAAACTGRQTDATSPGATGDRIGGQTVAGTWATTGIGPVYRESMTLTQTGTHVTGTGQYALEAGRQGPTIIEGDWVASTLTLRINRDYGVQETFTAKLTDATHLAGSLQIDGIKQSFSLAKR